jgi:hypothetical protein
VLKFSENIAVSDNNIDYVGSATVPAKPEVLCLLTD